MNKKVTTRQRGFTLIEVLVAMVILATTYGVLLKIFGGAIRNTDRIEDYRTALVIAESTLALAVANANEMPDGEVDDKFRWRVQSEQLSGVMPSEYVGHGGGPGLVSVTVEWDSAPGKQHQVQLSTVRLAGRTQ